LQREKIDIILYCKILEHKKPRRASQQGEG
jgi:hypothetical protein